MGRSWVLVGVLSALGCGDDDGSAADGSGGSTSVATSTRGTTTAADAASDSTGSSSAADTGASSSDSTGDPQPLQPPQWVCPDPDNAACASNDGPLLAGVAVRSVVPPCFESWVDEDDDAVFDPGEDFRDCGCDRRCPGDPGYRGPDRGEGDGEFQKTLMAGFQKNRPATGVRGADEGLVGDGDGISLRALVLDQASVRVALIAVDTVGIFRPDVTRIRAALEDAALDVDYVIVHAIHNHEGPDTMGLWGENVTTSGYDPDYGAYWRSAAIGAVEEAVAALTTVTEVRVGRADAAVGQPGGAANLIRDSRDPWVVDPTVSTLELREAGGQTLVTVVGYGCHPETLGSNNTLLTADYVHAVRRTIEQGSQWREAPGRAGVGGTAIFLSGALGGMMTTLGVSVTNPDGDTFEAPSFDKADSIGQLVGEAALTALERGQQLESPGLRVMAQSFELPVNNGLYVFGFESGVIERDVVTRDVPPRVVTEIALLELGPLRMLTVPGELLPEIAVGGYDGSGLHTEDAALVNPSNPNPPDLDAAPPGPYLLERLAPADGGVRPWLIGLGNDELGYIIPPYDFVLADSTPYLDEAEGDHYEETNSLGPQTAPRVEAEAQALIDYANASQ